jgi:hypothetical protein
MTPMSKAPSNTVPSILHSKPRTIRALNIWAQRLKAVPYDQWTLGAATALDHWIAVDVLGMTEDTWLKLLQGELETDLEQAHGSIQVGNQAKAHDIVTVRGYLFPETILATTTFEEEVTSEEDMTYEDDATNRSIDELLASLGGIDLKDDKDKTGKHEIHKDDQLAPIMDQLQEWRAKNQQISYHDWDSETKKNFHVSLCLVSTFAIILCYALINLCSMCPSHIFSHRHGWILTSILCGQTRIRMKLT